MEVFVAYFMTTSQTLFGGYKTQSQPSIRKDLQDKVSMRKLLSSKQQC
jgi:hypothetical protein